MASPQMISPSLALSMGVKPPPSRSRQHSLLPVGRSARCFPGLNLRPAAAALRPSSVVVRAHSRGIDARPPEEPNHFVAERQLILSRFSKIFNMDEGYLYRESTSNSAHFCSLAGIALRMASLVVDSSSLNVGAPNEISTETVHMTLHVYVNIFVRAAEDSYNRRVKSKIVLSFLGALKGVASVSHILLEAALESLSDINPRESLSEHALNTDMKTLHYEFDRKIDDLEDAFRKASTITACELLMPTISQGVRALESFVKVMVARRKRAIEKARVRTN